MKREELLLALGAWTPAICYRLETWSTSPLKCMVSQTEITHLIAVRHGSRALPYLSINDEVNWIWDALQRPAWQEVHGRKCMDRASASGIFIARLDLSGQ